MALLLLCSCESHKHAYSATTGWTSANPANGGFANDLQTASDKTAKPAERIMIYNASLTLSVRNTDSTNNHLARVAAKYEGYVLSMGTERSVIRVKAGRLNEALNSICTGGKLREKNVYSEDITHEYKDAKIRLENSMKARQRYLELLAKAENVEAALKVEKELERLNTEIDVLEGRLKRLEHLTEYSTITVNLEKKTRPGILGYVFVGLYKGVKWLFVRN